MKAHLFAAALLLSVPAAAHKAKKGAVPTPEPRPVRIILALPDALTDETADLLEETGKTVERLLGPEARPSSIGKPGEKDAKRVWTAPRWTEGMGEAERNLVLHGLKRLWGDDLKVDPEPKLPSDAPQPGKPAAPRPEAREELAASFEASGGRTASLAARFGALSDQGTAFDNAADRVTDAVAAVPAAPGASLPAFPAAPDAPPAAARPAVPAPEAKPQPEVGEGSKEHCVPLRGRGAKPGSSIEDIVAEEARCSGVSPDVIRALMAAKGGNSRNPLAVTGPAADWVGVKGDLRDPRTSVRAGSLLLAKLYRHFNGDLTRALAAYEVGITAVVRSGGVPNNRAVKDLLAEFQRAYRQGGERPVEPVKPPESPNLRRLDEEVRTVLTGDPLAPRVSFSATAPYRKAIVEAARMYGVDPDLIEAVILSESNGRPRLTSPAGAQGLMQLMPETARGLGVKDPFNTTQNINGGTKYLKQLLDRFNGNAVLAVAAYNAGPNRDSLEAGRVPTIRETVNYVTRVFHRYSQLTGTEMVEFSDRLTATGRRWHARESDRLERMWGATPERVPVPTPRPDPAPTAR